MKRTIQIGVIGSCQDLKYAKEAEKFASDLGFCIANSGYVLVFGAEKDIESLPLVAARSAKRANGVTVGITYDKGMDVLDRSACSVIIATGLIRGGGRETSLMLSCDVVIALAGGSGTLNELCVAYQANVPVVLAEGFGGWTDALVNTFLDERKRYKYVSAKTPESVIEKVELMIDKVLR